MPFQNSLLSGPLASLTKEANDDPTPGNSGPPNLHKVGLSSNQSCVACKHFQQPGMCTKYGAQVTADMTCDGFEPVNIDVNKIVNAAPAEPLQQLGNISPIKAARYRPDRRQDVEDWLHNMDRNKSTIHGSFVTPWRSSYEAMDKEAPEAIKLHRIGDGLKKEHSMSTKESFKAGFLLRCAEEGLTLDQINDRLDEALTKKASEGDMLGQGLGLAATVGLGLPLAGGAFTGYLRHKAEVGAAPPIEHYQRLELINKYRELADRAKRRRVSNMVEEESPGSVVRIE